VISGCCHSGIVNTLEAAASLFPDTPVQAVVAGHCTGSDALCALRRTFGERFRRLSVGQKFSLL
jgi:metal-dependent hydrolase (beta-lactamase superfamily II)